ncbi:MAG TPA: CPBP family intramembrane glutamic endopeptidase [Candidatus Acidoferrales bacterium]|jgi:membrane protease YdiL (CAAX protease family)|nr:CPBP family intramembrane glutamic endopeptidase [Candidatus Acidoferrales bacterium]
MHIVTSIVEVALAGFVVSEVVRFVPRYRQLKEAVASGDNQARTRTYQRALVFEWVSALLALAALGFDWTKFNPKLLGLADARLMQAVAPGSDAAHGAAVGVLIGVLAGTVGMIVARMKARRRGAKPGTRAVARQPWWRKLLPDFTALLPATTQERLLWVLVAVSAGVCEEIVFRGWLLAMLHGQAGLSGAALICVAAGLFGLAHIYQRAAGVILTAFAGALFCVLYVATGSLLVPIVLHIIVDARFALLPAPRVAEPQATASYA